MFKLKKRKKVTLHVQSRSWQTITHCENKMYWNAAMHIQLCIVYGCFCASWQNQQF